ncbi:cysteinyl leukotriene receptor 1 [Gastrophryne carolinensis]
MSNTTEMDIADFRNKVYSTTYSMYTIFGLTGNCFALYILIKTYNQKTSFHIYMLNLVISDLLFIVTLPFRVVYYMGHGNWIFGDFLCRVCSYSFYVNLYCSIFILTAMSITRFLAIVHPVKNLKYISVKRAKWVCVGIWVFVTLTSSPFLINGTKHDSTTNTTICFGTVGSSSVLKILILNYISLTLGFIAPFLIILVCYVMIIKTLLKNSMKKQQSSRKKAIWMIIIVLVVFFVSFTPYHIQRTLHLHYLKNKYPNTIWHHKKAVICLALAASNCCFDPLLYFFSGENFRKRLSTVRKQSVTSFLPEKRKKSGSLHDKTEVLPALEKQDSDIS